MRIILAIFAITLMHTSNLSAQTQEYKAIVVSFYNLENLFDTINQPDVDDEEFTPTGKNKYTGEVFTDKVTKLSTVISQIATDITPEGPAVLGVAEIENRSVLEALCTSPLLAKRNYQIVHYNSPDLRGVDVGLLYNPKVFTYEKSASLFVPLFDANGSPRYTRDVLWVQGKIEGETYHFFVNHWPSRRGGEEASAPGRAAAAGVARAVIDSIQKVDPNAKCILMGDLNDNPSDVSLTKVMRSKGKVEQVANDEFYNPWVDFYKKGYGTLGYQDTWSLFDQIIISQNLLDKTQQGFHFTKAYIFNKEFMVQKTGKYKGYPMRTYDGNIYYGGYSDHFPTYILLLKPVKK